MAEILVLARDNSARPGFNPAVHFEKYDIIAVKDDGYSWGTQEQYADFYIFRIPGKTAAELAYLTESYEIDQQTTDPDTGEVIETSQPLYLRRHRFNFDTHFTQAELDAIAHYTNGFLLYDINVTDIEDKTTG